VKTFIVGRRVTVLADEQLLFVPLAEAVAAADAVRTTPALF